MKRRAVLVFTCATLSIAMTFAMAMAACTAFTGGKPESATDGSALVDGGGVATDGDGGTTTPPLPTGDLAFDGSLPLFEDPCADMKPRCGGNVVTLQFDDQQLPNMQTSSSGGMSPFKDSDGQKLCEPNALQAVANVQNEIPAVAYIAQPLNGSFRGIYLRYAVRDVQVPSGGSLKFGCGLWLSDEGGDATTQIRFKVSHPDQYELDGESTNGSDPSGTKFASPPGGASAKLIGAEIFAWLDTKANVIKLAGTYDGVFTLGPDLPYPARPTKAELRCGILLADNADGTYTVNVDNVSVELCP